MNKKLLSSLLLSIMVITACGGNTSTSTVKPSTSNTPSSSSVVAPSSTVTPSTPDVTPSTPSTPDVTPSTPSSTVTPSSSSTVVEPLTISINGEGSVWYDETLTLTVEYSKVVEDTVIWTSSDEAIATVENGVVTPKAAGTVVISAKLASDETISATHEVVVKDVVIDTSVDDGGWDFSSLKQDNPTIKTNGTEGSYKYETFANFKNVSGQKYYAEATFKMTSFLADNTWNRIAVGHRDMNANGGVQFRAYHASYGNGGDSIKTVVMEQPLTWGEDTDRTQVWNQGGRKNWDFTNLKLATLRNGNTYYYFVNDQLSWVESINERFNNIDTVPAITASDMNVEVSNMFATSNEEYVNAKLAEKETNKLFWGTIDNSVTVDETGDTPKITFDKSKDNSGNWPSSNIKDYAARSLGDALSIPAGKSATFTYDYKVTQYGNDTDASFTGLTFQRHTNNVKEMRSILVGKYKAAANAWGWDGGINIGSSGFWDYENSTGFTSSVKENETYTVKIEVNAYDTYREYRVYINDKDTGLCWGDWDKYTGALIVNVTGLSISSEISNFQYTIA